MFSFDVKDLRMFLWDKRSPARDPQNMQNKDQFFHFKCHERKEG